MPFQKGNKYGKGGNHGGPRPLTKAKREAMSLRDRLAFDMAREFLENSFKPIMVAYLGLATGGKAGRKLKLDPATCRHAVERALGQAPRTVTLDMQDSIESLFEKVLQHGGKEKAIDVTEEGEDKEGG